MRKTTVEAIDAIMRADDSATDAERLAVKALLDGNETPIPRLLTRGEVARLMNKTTRMVDYYASRGFIKRVVLGNNGRASGFDAESVRAFLVGAARAEGGAA